MSYLIRVWLNDFDISIVCLRREEDYATHRRLFVLDELERKMFPTKGIPEKKYEESENHLRDLSQATRKEIELLKHHAIISPSVKTASLVDGGDAICWLSSLGNLPHAAALRSVLLRLAYHDPPVRSGRFDRGARLLLYEAHTTTSGKGSLWSPFLCGTELKGESKCEMKQTDMAMELLETWRAPLSSTPPLSTQSSFIEEMRAATWLNSYVVERCKEIRADIARMRAGTATGSNTTTAVESALPSPRSDPTTKKRRIEEEVSAFTLQSKDSLQPSFLDSIPSITAL